MDGVQLCQGGGADPIRLTLERYSYDAKTKRGGRLPVTLSLEVIELKMPTIWWTPQR